VTAPHPVVEDTFLHQIIGGRYRVTAKIASGGMGDVYLAQHAQIDQRVAIKFLARRLTGDAQIVQRFFNEARTIGKVNHPGAVTLNDFGQTPDGTLYIIMEYIEGEPLNRFVENSAERRLSSETAVHIALQLCDVLDAAHKQGVIHRDLKPENIMVTPGRKGRPIVKILDFGIAKLLTEDNRLTQTGMVYGTPEFMSPEQATGADIDGRADLYAVACILYYMICGKPPFQFEHPMATMRAQASDPPPPLHVRTPGADVTPALEAVILRGLAKAPTQRPATIAAFADELEDLQLTLSGAFQAIPRGRRRLETPPSPAQPTADASWDGPNPMTGELPNPYAAKTQRAPALPKPDDDGPDGPESLGVGDLHDPRDASFDMGRDPTAARAMLDQEHRRSTLQRTSRWPLLAALAVLVLLAAGLGVIWYTQQGEDAPDEPSQDAGPAQDAAPAPQEDAPQDAAPSLDAAQGALPAPDAPDAPQGALQPTDAGAPPSEPPPADPPEEQAALAKKDDKPPSAKGSKKPAKGGKADGKGKGKADPKAKSDAKAKLKEALGPAAPPKHLGDD
jgi:serine/threonine-protein kinase